MRFRCQHLILWALFALSSLTTPALAGHQHSPKTASVTKSAPAISASQRFIQTLNSALRQQNQQLEKDRARIQRIAQRYLHNDDISESDFNWLKETTRDYQLEPQQRGDQAYFHALLQRVDSVPASLAIAQAIIETGWGEASSTAKAHNPFGLLSGHRNLMQFPNQQAAVAYYVRLLNTAKPYEPFRKLRAQARSKNKNLHGEQLANGLIKYSTQGQSYIHKVQHTIQINHLAKLD